MDTSKKYVDMCMKSPIRSNWKWKEGDFYAGKVHTCRDPEFNDVEWPVEYGGVCSEDHDPNYRAGCGENWYSELWPLPRQDQLQHIITDVMRKPLSPAVNFQLQEWFNRWLTNTIHKDNSFVDRFSTFEQLWLLFVMEQKYNKKWDGDNWKDKEE